MRFAAAVSHEEGVYIAHCLEVEIAGEGPTQEAAVESLRHELELYLKAAPAVGPPASGPHIGPVEVVVTESVSGPPPGSVGAGGDRA